MKFFSLLLAAPLVSALVQRDGPLSLNPPTDNLVPVTHENAVAHYPELAADVARRHYTNAQRLARGLSPNPPLSVRKTLKSRTPTRVQHAARAGPSPVPTGGVIRAVDANGVDFGFVNAPLNIFGEYGITQSADTVLAVSAQLPADGSAFDVVATNPVVSSLPLVGFTTGFANSDSNLGPGSLNYAYLTAQSTSTGTGSTPQGSPNSFTTATGIDKQSESTVWTYDLATGELIPHWTNADGTAATITLAYYQPDDVYIITGDLATFTSSFGANTLTPVHFYVSGPPSKR